MRAYVEILPVLQAEESLLAQTRLAVGTGSLKPDAARDILRSWERAAERPGQKKRPAVKATPQTFIGTGIGVQLVTEAKKESGT